MDNTLKVKGRVEVPKEGMFFDTVDELKECYRRYANEFGFVVINRTVIKGDDGERIYAVFACSYSGKGTSNSKNIRRRLPSAKTDCKAKLSATRCPDGRWQVTIFRDEHNHILSPGNPQPVTKRRHVKNDTVGTSVNKISDPCLVEPEASGRVVEPEAGDCENASIFEKDFRNYTDKVTRLRLVQGDASAIHNYFMKMQGNNSNFFYTMDLDDEGCLRNVFWADARSRTAYEEYGDAIIFDTTYLTNKYDLPFVAFLGVNHHGQSTLLGCGLLSSEDTETYTWLFQSWLACMSGCAPKAIITGHDKSMQKAIELVFPNTRYRWCLWHLMKQLPEMLGGYNQYEAINFLLQNIVYDSLTPDEFEVRWNRMIEKYNLESNEWLLCLYDERHRWVPAFLKDTFWAGMSTTQDSAFFDGYVNSKTTLKQFVEQYEKAMRSKVEKENCDDLNSLSLQIPCITHYAMEKQFQDAYTHTKFKEFQHELTGKICCELSSVKKDATMSEYEISEDLKVGEIDRRATFKVSLTHDHCDIHCSCCLFETGGILCRHAIVVLIHNKILRVPEKYISPRWSKSLKRRHTQVKISYADSSGKPEVGRCDKMCNAFCEVAELAADSEDKTKMVMDWINEVKSELKRGKGTCGTSQPIIPPDNGATGGVLPVSIPFKRKHSKGEQVSRRYKEKRRMESNSKSTTDSTTMQKSQEGEEVGNGNGGRNGALPTMHFPNANLFMWAVPQSGLPGTSGGSSLAPPMLAYSPGYVMNNTIYPMFPQGPIPPPKDHARLSARQARKLRKMVPRYSDQRAPVIPLWRSSCGMDAVSNSIGMVGINDTAQPPDVLQPTAPNLEGSTVAQS